MLRNCPDCENDATLGARFCRTCGGRLFPESDVTTATTRSYSPEQAAAAQFAAPETPPAQNFAPPNAIPDPVMDSVNTARLYHPPPVPANQDVERPKKSWKALWITLAIIFVMLVVSVGMAGFFISKQIRGAIEQGKRTDRRAPVGIPGIPDIPPPPALPASGEAKSIQLDDLKYPDASIEENHKAAGQEILEMVTDDSLDEVKEFYRDALGIDPMVENQKEKSFVFMTGEPSVYIITAETDQKSTDKIRITVIHPDVPFLDKFLRYGKKQKDGASVNGAKIHEEVDRQKAEIDRQKAELDRQKEAINRRKQELQRQKENLQRPAPQNQ